MGELPQPALNYKPLLEECSLTHRHPETGLWPLTQNRGLR